MVRWWSPRLWGVHLLGLVCVAVAAGMGTWQYDAWQTRRAAEQVDLTEAEPLPLTDVIGPDDPFPTAGLGRPVELEGTWLGDATVLVSGREDADGDPGAWVVTPITVGSATAPAVPVVRGWVPEGTTLDDLGPRPSGQGAVLGWLQPPEPGAEADDTDEDAGDDVLPSLRIADIVQRVDQDLYGAYVVAQEPSAQDAAAGLEAATLDQLPPASRFTGLRNILYAVEWWFFGLFAAFLWWRHVRDTTREGREDEAEGGAGEDDAVGSQA